MRKTVMAVLVPGLLVASTAFAANAVRISQVYPGAVGPGYFKYDYVEIFNSSGSFVNIGGWSVQYGSGMYETFDHVAAIPAGTTIAPCGYYLIAWGNEDPAGVADLPTPDLTVAAPNLAATRGKVAIFTDQVAGRTCAQAKALPPVDLMAYGADASSCWETARAEAIGHNVNVRRDGGMQDTDDNSADFVSIDPASVTVVVHNSSMRNEEYCLPVPALPPTWGEVKILYR